MEHQKRNRDTDYLLWLTTANHENQAAIKDKVDRLRESKGRRSYFYGTPN